MARSSVSENEIIRKINAIKLKDGKSPPSVSVKNYTKIIAHKLRKNREGIISCKEQIRNLEFLTNRMHTELSHGNKELKKLKKNIIKSDMLNAQLELNIMTQMRKNNSHTSRISFLKKKKMNINKEKGIIDSDINYMETRVTMIKQNVEENEKKYYKLIGAKDKLHNEMLKFKKDRKDLQHHLNHTKRNHDLLKNQMQNFIVNMGP
ncbi:conserved Plasmodium protein, unknown function [Plasmodium knowlesi strain H]|uniref:Uncharacterized protein n=3 Tax=Plasmodium knowlesi TaxID=5850 RepID=A0A1A7VQK4_PLAKH|nr:conserved Plasmodium protein, unknown function [Plasmodium knowlesi strain H]OTN68423.1 Uncharacterized protein PKNOH_S02300900 [Plasmodium knowlesi]CAA9986512.1 conserved Plasmodium protein, unknown function [Plasmodium knowlesi strain H]SBO24226.1 conserved Plasmodium protein, unknown function [Plasmodium knowlesi strain H]SBO29759.1 conserved Plasmodium protein, unknown function [Plasmodium knowlesi strain H]VVS75986.1 conserved Plasmodium protein, unknown function [Plasmodium knowlesi s